MITLKRTDSSNSDFIYLVEFLDADLKIRDGKDHDFYNQFNAIVNIKNCIVGYDGEIPVACGAIKPYDDTTAEVKRMFVLPKFRGKGFAGAILSELEKWSKELGFEKCVLETGVKQPEAIALYNKSGYKISSNYGQYEGIENSICFAKFLS